MLAEKGLRALYPAQGRHRVLQHADELLRKHRREQDGRLQHDRDARSLRVSERCVLDGRRGVSTVRGRPAEVRRAAFRASALAAGILALVACGRGAESSGDRVVRPDDLTALYGTGAHPADVERVLGPPDQRMPDGALRYEHVKVGKRSGETITIRFTDGKVSRICRSRS